MDHVNHKQNCVPDEDFNGKPPETANDTEVKPKFQCQKCGERFTNMVWYSKHQGTCNKHHMSPDKSPSYVPKRVDVPAVFDIIIFLLFLLKVS